jgi:hypothetical protein
VNPVSNGLSIITTSQMLQNMKQLFAWKQDVCTGCSTAQASIDNLHFCQRGFYETTIMYIPPTQKDKNSLQSLLTAWKQKTNMYNVKQV